MTDEQALTVVEPRGQAVALAMNLTSVPPLAKRIVKAALAVGSVPERGQVSGRISYQYAAARDVKAAARRALADNGIAIIPTVRHVEQCRTGNMTISRCHLSFVLACEDGAIEVPWVADSQDASDKGVNKAITTGLKYFLINLLQIPTGIEEDTDTDDTRRGEQATGNNGNAKPATVMTMEWAAGHKTPKGTPFGQLTREQLQKIIEKMPAGSAEDVAARMLLDALDNPAIWPNETLAAVIQAGLTKNVHSAKNTLVKAKSIDPNDAADLVVEWFRHYRTARGQELEPDDAAAYADEQMQAVPI